jgi:hypothetical protein
MKLFSFSGTECFSFRTIHGGSGSEKQDSRACFSFGDPQNKIAAKLDARKTIHCCRTRLQIHSALSALERYQGHIKVFHFSSVRLWPAKKNSPEVLFPGIYKLLRDLVHRRIVCAIRLGLGLSLRLRLRRWFNVVCLILAIFLLLLYLRQSFFFAGFLPVRHQLFLRQRRLRLGHACHWRSIFIELELILRWRLRWLERAVGGKLSAAKRLPCADQDALQPAVSPRAHNDVVNFWTVQQCAHHVLDCAWANLGDHGFIL